MVVVYVRVGASIFVLMCSQVFISWPLKIDKGKGEREGGYPDSLGICENIYIVYGFVTRG